MFTKVTFHGHELWFDREDFEVRGHGALAPVEHVKDGELDMKRCFGSDSFAHVYRDCVMRYHANIGTPDEIVDGWASEAADAAITH